MADEMDEAIKRAMDEVASLSVAQQLLATASTIKRVHVLIDELQAEMIKQLNEIRRIMGSRP